jgi:ferritin-like metal-binding protein YciE
LYLDELSDLYDAESQGVRLLTRLQDATHTPALRDQLRLHCDQSRLHLERLELIFTHWGAQAGSRPCRGLSGIGVEADDRLQDAATGEVSDVIIVAIARRVEHYEIAGYGVARALAWRLNRSDEARLLQETLDDESRADGRLDEIDQVNRARRSERRAAANAAGAPGSAAPPHGDRPR